MLGKTAVVQRYALWGLNKIALLFFKASPLFVPIYLLSSCLFGLYGHVLRFFLLLLGVLFPFPCDNCFSGLLALIYFNERDVLDIKLIQVQNAGENHRTQYRQSASFLSCMQGSWAVGRLEWPD